MRCCRCDANAAGRSAGIDPTWRWWPRRSCCMRASTAMPKRSWSSTSTAWRRMELARLKISEIDLESREVRVRSGKGNRDRVVPLGSRAGAWIERYLREVRPLLASGLDRGELFLTDYGEPFRKNRLGDRLQPYVRRAGLPGACHLFRHACATHMLENGADIRYIQAMLGHSQLTTTEIYTHVSIVKLREVHAATHPACLRRESAQSQPQSRVDEAARRKAVEASTGSSV